MVQERWSGGKIAGETTDDDEKERKCMESFDQTRIRNKNRSLL